MSIAVLALPKIPPLYFFFGGLIVLIFILPAFRSSARKKERSAVFQSMGFAEVPREQVFEDVSKAARVIYDRPASSISSPVGKGNSAAGEAVIFDFSYGAGTSATYFTVVGFRVSPDVADFEIRHSMLGDRLFGQPAGENIKAESRAAASAPAQLKSGPGQAVYQPSDAPVQKRITMEGNPDFAKKYVVWAADEGRVRRIVTPVLMDSLVAMNDSNLHIRKGSKWIFVYREVARARSPKQYPALLEEAAGLVSKLDLRAASGTA
jgi:Protein of unknown function (DUF3137)